MRPLDVSGQSKLDSVQMYPSGSAVTRVLGAVEETW